MTNQRIFFCSLVIYYLLHFAFDDFSVLNFLKNAEK